MVVGQTILHAWKFAGRRVLPLLGLGWIAAAFYCAAASYFLGQLSNAMLVWPRPDAGGFNNFALFYLFCLVVVTAFANAVMGLSMTREAVEPGGEWKTAYFSVARREWSLFANLLLLYVIVIGLVATIVFAGSVGIAVSLPMIGNGGVWNGVDFVPVMKGVIIAVAIVAGLFLSARFGFFLVVLAAADPPARLLQAWVLSRGNFFKLLSVSFGLLVPVLAIFLLMDWAVLGERFVEALASFFSGPRNTAPFFQLVRDNSDAIAAVAAVAVLVWNAIFAGASAEAYLQTEHGAQSAASPAIIAEPALAMAVMPTPATAADERRIEPGFSDVHAAGHPGRLSAPEEATTSAKGDISGTAQEESAVAPVPGTAAEKELPHADHEMEEIEFRTVEDAPSPTAVESAAAEWHESEDASAEPAQAVSEPPEEPLVPQEPLPAMDPLGHAAPAAPDPAGAETTPLPSFVTAQTSRERDSSEAA